MPAAPARLRLPRFSLRSLILFVTLTGSGYGLWHNRRPWATVSVLTGHSGAVTSAAYSPDGKRIITASWDSTVRVWDAAGGRPLAVLEAHGDAVNSAMFSPDGTRIVTGGGSAQRPPHTARVWERHHPEQWWGLAWLPEFWVTLALGGLLMWSLMRDRGMNSKFKVQGSKAAA